MSQFLQHQEEAQFHNPLMPKSKIITYNLDSTLQSLIILAEEKCVYAQIRNLLLVSNLTYNHGQK